MNRVVGWGSRRRATGRTIAWAIVVAACAGTVTPSRAEVSAMLREKMSPAVRESLAKARASDRVTVVVRMKGRGQLRATAGERAGVFAELRSGNALMQRGLVDALASPAVAGRVDLVRAFWLDRLVLVRASRDVIEEIAARDDVERVFENFVVTLPPRPRASAETPPSAAGSTPSWDPLAHIGVKRVWSTYGLTGAGVRIGGLDTGVDISHPDLAGKMVTLDAADPTYPGGWAEIDPEGNPMPGSRPHDTEKHGTHTSGTMVAGNASGYDVGVAPGARLMHALVIPHGSGYFSQIIGGMEWIIDPDGDPATDDGADVVNMSLGASGALEFLIAPVENMLAAGVFLVAAIGNSGPGPMTTGSPGNVPSAFASGATGPDDEVAGFSSRGPVVWDSPPYVGTFIKPDICAPGVQIFSTVPGGRWEWTSSAGDWNGTSMAAPHISGTAALMLEAKPDLTVETLRYLLERTSIDLGVPGKDNAAGMGRVDAFAAVTAARGGIGVLEGTVSSSSGGPVANARVRIVDTGQEKRTDDAGHYSIQLVAGEHTVEYAEFGYETHTESVTIASETVHRDVTLTQYPSGVVTGAVTAAATGAGIGSTVSALLSGTVVKSVACDASTGRYRMVLPAATYDLRFDSPFPYAVWFERDVVVGASTTIPFDLVLDPAQILLVDDDEGGTYETIFERAIADAGRTFVTLEASQELPSDLSMFESLVWFTGDDYQATLVPEEQAIVAAYLDGGGRLFLTGQDIGYHIHRDPFYAEYLHAELVADDSGLRGILGEPASVVGAGFEFAIQGRTGANNQAFPSVIKALSSAHSAFVYDISVPPDLASANRAPKNGAPISQTAITGSAGLTYENGVHRLVYFSFGFEAIATAPERAAVMGRVLDWLQGYPEIVHEPLRDTEDTSHPYVVEAAITSDQFELDATSFAVVYDAGAGPVRLPMHARGASDHYAAEIPAQSPDTHIEYYLEAGDVSGHVSTHPLGAPLFTHAFDVGKDREPPAIDVTDHFNTNDRTGPYRIDATVTDNLAVESVYLVYRKNGGSAHRIKMRQDGGVWSAGIPGPAEVGESFQYHVVAIDGSYSGNGARAKESGEYGFRIVEEFAWDFEADDGGLASSGSAWEWGAPLSGPNTAHSGTKVWGTTLAGNHPDDMNAKLDLPAIVLDASQRHVVLSLWQWYAFESYVDGGNVKVSTDHGATWEVVTPFEGYDGVAAAGTSGIADEPCFTGHDRRFWHPVTFDLSSYRGQTIVVRMHAGSNLYVTNPGWYVDDVRLRSTDVDDVPPVFVGVTPPASTLDVSGPYPIAAAVRDLLSGVAEVSAIYSTDEGATWHEVAMSRTTGDAFAGAIPGLPRGSRVRLYVRATDAGGNETVSPPPGTYHRFEIVPGAPTLVLTTASNGIALDDFRAALDESDHEADYWNLHTQGSAILDHLGDYETVVVDQRPDMKANELAKYAEFLGAGSSSRRKGFFLLGRDAAYSSAARTWVSQWMRADYVQDDPGYREISAQGTNPIGNGETFVVSGPFPDEVQRARDYPGGDVVYRFNGPGVAASTLEAQNAHEKTRRPMDTTAPSAPVSLDAAAGIAYNGETYRSVFLTFNFDYVTERERRAGIADRVLRWLDAPVIVHEPLADTEDTLSAYHVVVRVHSDQLDAARVRLTYDAGAGPVAAAMSATANPSEFAGAIPAQRLGTTVRYYIGAANLDGNVAQLPEGAPNAQFTFLVTRDDEPPRIEHVPVGFTSNLAGPYAITATVTDNVEVDPAGVLLTYRKNGGTTTTVAMTKGAGDEFNADIPGPSVVGDSYQYAIEARDLAKTPNLSRSPATGFHVLDVVDYAAWDFERDDGGFPTAGADWQWGAPTAGPTSAHSGANVWGTVLDGTYSSNSNSTLDTPAILVPTTRAHAELSFWQWYYIEPNFDGGNVKISTDDGATWTLLTPIGGYTGTARAGNAGIAGEACFTGYNHAAWERVVFDLTAYRGQSVRVRWHFGSDRSVNRFGWYLDDVRIEGVETPSEPVPVAVADCLVIVGGTPHVEPMQVVQVFALSGRRAHVWDWDRENLPTIDILDSYRVIVVDHGGTMEAAQQTLLDEWLDRDDGASRRLFRTDEINSVNRRAAAFDEVIESLATPGAAVETQPDRIGVMFPTRISMDQNVPNPFNPTTSIRVGVPPGINGAVVLEIYNVRGQLVRTLFRGHKAPGWYTFEWDGRNSDGEPVASGVYIACFDDSQVAVTRKMVLLK